MARSDNERVGPLSFTERGALAAGGFHEGRWMLLAVDLLESL